MRHLTDALESEIEKIKISHCPGMLKIEHDKLKKKKELSGMKKRNTRKLV